MTRDELLALSDERDLWERRFQAAWRFAYELGYNDGDRAGYERGARVLEAEWPAVVKPLSGPSLADLEGKRWGPGGREHFGDPRPTDRIRPPLERRRAA